MSSEVDGAASAAGRTAAPGVEPHLEIALELSAAVAGLRFGAPVTHVYNPLQYAWEPHAAYLTRYGAGSREVVLVGMNPGPFGMAQTGVPFGEVGLVRDWLRLGGEIGKPRREHPRRPVEGFSCPRSEVSGRRLWGWAQRRFGSPEAFFARFFVANYCPLLFLEESGRNRTPDKLPAAEAALLFGACDRALRLTVELLAPRFVLGIGRFAERRARMALSGLPVEIAGILHPSPANPLASRGWEEALERRLAKLGPPI